MYPGIGSVSAETLDAVRKALGAFNPNDPTALLKAGTTTGITVGSGLLGYNLEAPAKLLQPQVSILRNRFPRKGGGFSDVVRWKKITSINASKLKAGVAEGARNSFLQMSTVDATATYKDFGLDGYVTFEAVDRSKNFEDTRARGVAATLQATMIEEEKYLLGGNVTAIGKPASMTIADGTATAGPFTAATAYDFGVSALTAFGYINSATGHGTVDALDETDARTNLAYTGTAGGKTSIQVSWPAVRGAVAYNVYVGADGGTRYYAFTTTQTSIVITSAVLAALPVAGNVANTADATADALAFDGVIPQVAASAGLGYFKDLAGATLTADNAGGIAEWDAALLDIFNRTLTGPTAILVGAQTAKDATAKVAAGGSSTTFRLNATIGDNGTISGGLRLGSYLNKFTQQDIPLITHGYLPAGITIFITEALPYPNSEIPNVFEVDVLREYTQYDWPIVVRRFEYGVYGAEVLKVYFPSACGMIVGYAAG